MTAWGSGGAVSATLNGIGVLELLVSDEMAIKLRQCFPRQRVCELRLGCPDRCLLQAASERALTLCCR